MRTLRIAVLLYLYALTIQAEAPKRTVPAGSKVYVESPDGFDIYMTKAIEEKQILLTVVAEKENAEFVISVTSVQGQRTNLSQEIGATLGNGRHHSNSVDEAAMKVVNRSTGEVVFLREVRKTNAIHGRQSAAEVLAKHLKDIIVK